MDAVQFAAIIDVETTGGIHYVDEIIELSIKLISFDRRSGCDLTVADSYLGQREPRVEISKVAAAKHHLTFGMLKGKELDRSAISRVLSRADFLVAHWASFDQRFVIPEFREVCDKPWLCTVHDIDWAREGCGKHSLGALLDWFSLASDRLHRAEADTTAVVALLQQVAKDGRPFLAQLLEKLHERNLRANQASDDVLREWQDAGLKRAARRHQWEEDLILGGAPVASEPSDFKLANGKIPQRIDDLLTQPPPDMTFPGKVIVFTGDFSFGTRQECAAAASERGARVDFNLTAKTDYLIVGSRGDDRYKNGFYGDKIKTAYQNARSGHPVALVSEDHWVSEMKRVTKSSATLVH